MSHQGLPITLAAIPYNLGEVHSAVASLEEVVANLIKRLSPVSTPSPVLATNSTVGLSVPHPESSDIANSARGAELRIHQIRRDLEEATNLLEV